MLSTDKSILDPKSEAALRMARYGSVVDELCIIVYAPPSLPSSAQLAGNVHAYSTNTARRWRYFFDAYRIAKSLNQVPFSLVTSQDPFETGLLGWFLKKKWGVPLQVQIHTDIFNSYFIKESLKNRLRSLCASWLLPEADGIRAVSERIKDSLRRRYRNFSALKNEPAILPVWVDVKKIQRNKGDASLRSAYSGYEHILLMASRLTWEKNIGLAIESLPFVLEKLPRTLLLVVGDGPELASLKEKAKPVSGNVVFEPWSDNLAAYYKMADAYLLTSNYEGYGRTVIEAMAAGIPVVMTDVGLAGELLVGDFDGKVVPAGDARACADAIMEVLSNPELKEEFVKNASKVIEELPDEKSYLEAYRHSFEAALKKLPTGI